jgi:hypothetical protein
MSYAVEIGQTGRGGTITYSDRGSLLSFDWEFAIDGVDMFVPTPEQWDAFCQSRDAAWAKGKRQEILAQVAEEVRKQKATSAVVTIADNWVHFAF